MLTATIFDSVGCARATPFTKPWSELVRMLEKPESNPDKTSGRLLKLARFGQRRTAAHSLKHDDNVVEVTGIEGDYDAGAVTVEQAIAMLEKAGIRATVYTSWSDGLVQPPKYNGGPRWRVLAPLSKPYPPEERERLLARLNGALGGILAGESFTLSQGYFFDKRPGANFRCVSTFDDPEDGKCIDELDDLDFIAIGKRSKVEPSSNGIGKAHTDVPIGAEMFATAVEREGHLLCSGEGRRELLKSYIASRSARGLPAGDVRLLIDGIAARFFDPCDPMDEKNIAELVNHFARKDSKPEVDFSAAFDDVPGTGERVHRLSIRNAIKLADRPEAVNFVVDDFIQEGVVFIAGQQGVGKTTALLPLAMAQAGFHEHGYSFAPKKPDRWRHVIYITEDPQQASRIIAAMAYQLRFTVEQVQERVHIIPAVAMDAALFVQVRDEYSELFAIESGVKLPPLVVADTRSACFTIESENDNAAMSELVAQLKQNFAGLPIWVVAHLAKEQATRSNAATLSVRGAGSAEGDAHQVMFLVREQDESRWLVRGKTRFESPWKELHLRSELSCLMAVDRWGEMVSMDVRWAVAEVPQATRSEMKEQAQEVERLAEAAEVRSEVRDAVQTAWNLGHPLNREGVKAKVKRKAAIVVTAMEALLSEGWLYEVAIPSKERTHPKRSSYLVALSLDQYEAFLESGLPPDELLEVPQSWRKKAPVSSIPDAESFATKSEAS